MVAPFWVPRRLFESDSNNVPWATLILCQMKSIYLFKSPIYDFLVVTCEVSKQIRQWCTCTKQSGAHNKAKTSPKEHVKGLTSLGLFMITISDQGPQLQ